jgi:hypothetical protein
MFSIEFKKINEENNKTIENFEIVNTISNNQIVSKFTYIPYIFKKMCRKLTTLH